MSSNLQLHQIINRYFSTTRFTFKKVVPNNLKGKTTSSQQWLLRQLKDPYVEKAKMMNYRCRSAFKLIEIDDKYNILKPGHTVLDCGAAPGSWTQISVQRTNADLHMSHKPQGMVIAIDRLQIYPIENAHILGDCDFTMEDSQNRIKSILGNKLVDVVLSDMAPKASGIKDMDQENIIKLCYIAFRFACEMSNIGAILLVKLWQGKGDKQLESDLNKFYKIVKFVKPMSSRSDSAEVFLLARDFKGLKK